MLCCNELFRFPKAILQMTFFDEIRICLFPYFYVMWNERPCEGEEMYMHMCMVMKGVLIQFKIHDACL